MKDKSGISQKDFPGQYTGGEKENFAAFSDFFGFDVRPYTTAVRFECDEMIMEEEKTAEYLYYMFEGRAKLYLPQENGRVSLVNFLSAPCFIGEMELIGAQKTANAVRALTLCRCYAIRIRDCREKLLNDPTFLRSISLFVSRKALENTNRYSKNQLYPLEMRLAEFILMTGTHSLYRERHTEAAAYLGVTYRHLLYVLADFIKRGILQRTERGYLILDMDRLRAIAKGKKE